MPTQYNDSLGEITFGVKLENGSYNPIGKPVEFSILDLFNLPMMNMSLANHMIPLKVIFNDPATIVYWADETKTVVKVKAGETFDKWTGFAMCVCKKLYGRNFHKMLKRWCDDWD